MKNHEVWRLCYKLLLLFGFFAIAGGIAIVITPTPLVLQRKVLEEKINKLIIDSPVPVDVIVGGDSRAKQQIIPSLFKEDTNLETANVAVGSGDFIDLYSSLAAQGLVNKKKLIIVSISIAELNDGAIRAQGADAEVINSEPLSIQKAADLQSYLSILFYYYYEHLRGFIRPDIANTDFMDANTLANKGYFSVGGIIQLPLAEGANDTNPWYRDINLNGTKLLLFKNILQAVGSSTDTVVLYEAPIAPAWRLTLGNTNIIEEEAAFAKEISAAVAPYHNIYFINYSASDVPDLTNAQFSDAIHLNDNGAHVFTTILVSDLKKMNIAR